MMSVAHKDSIAMAKETYERTMANIRRRVLHSILDKVLDLNADGHGLRLTVDYDACVYLTDDRKNQAIRVDGTAILTQVEQYAEALAVLEDMGKESKREEVGQDAEAV